MPDTPYTGRDMQAYIAALDQLVGDQNPLEILKITPEALRAFFAGVAEEIPDRPEAPGKWSMRDVIAHLFDVELVYAYRMRMILASDQPRFLDMDQDRWAEARWYRETPTEVLLDALVPFREMNLVLLGGLTPEQEARTGIHSKRGEESAAVLMVRWAGHDLVHLKQLERIRAAVA